MSEFEIKIKPDAILLPSVLSAIETYAGQFFKDKKDIDRLALAVEEAIGNVLNFSVTGRMTDITVTVDSEGGEFTVCVLDLGRPGNYEETLKGEQRIGLTIMKNAVDVVRVENLGHGGRRQKLIKYYAGMPDFAPKKFSEDEKPIENAVITVRAPKREEMVEISRAFYEEYGLNYGNEIVYYPERLYAAVAKDQIYSTVAVDQNGNLAGHFGCFQWSSITGIWEAGMAVVSKRYRNAGIFNKMMKRNYDHVCDEVKGKFLVGGCVMMHPYSQKMLLNYGFSPCGFHFNLIPADVSVSTFNKEGGYTHEACAGRAFFFGERTVYIAEELREPVEYILDGVKLRRTLCTESFMPQTDFTQSSWAYNDKLRSGEITVNVIGRDCVERLGSDCLELRTRGAETVTLSINACEEGFNVLYEAAKAEGFFFTALVPNGDRGDFAIMQRFFGKAVDYENLVTVEPYTTLLKMVKKLDPDCKKRL